MKTRREFLSQATTTLLLIPLAACSSAGASAAPSFTTSDAGSCDGVASTSTNVSEHTHALCVPTSDLSHPPPNGATYTTSSSPDPLATGAPDDGAHTHTVTLTQAQLASVQEGMTVDVTTSTTLDHTHVFAILRARTV